MGATFRRAPGQTSPVRAFSKRSEVIETLTTSALRPVRPLFEQAMSAPEEADRIINALFQVSLDLHRLSARIGDPQALEACRRAIETLDAAIPSIRSLAFAPGAAEHPDSVPTGIRR